MFLDLKEYGFEKFAYEISLDKITSVGGPFFVKHFAVNSGFSGAFASSINKLLAGDEANFKWNANYVPPHEKRMLGQVTVVFPHHFINIKCDGEHYQLAHANVGYKFKSFGGVENGSIDPRLQELYDYLVKSIEKKKAVDENNISFEGNKDINDDAYQLYLVEKYNIKKNDTLNKFVLNKKPYSDLLEVLKIAHDLETS
tara:strand:- start:76 stop:672 length:597 start_codon:yes stop_codon:yes gene_type:complete